MMGKTLAIIPARAGSKGLPGKNIKMLGGKPLIGWTIKAALEASCIDIVMVSTDCPEIASVAKVEGAQVPFLRPAHLASDCASTVDVVAHAVHSLSDDFDVIVLLQPTSPFRGAQHIKEAFDMFSRREGRSVVGVCESPKSPVWMFWKDSNTEYLSPVFGEIDGASRRQDLRKAYCLNGSIYIISTKLFMDEKKFIFEDTLAYEMQRESSMDIDDIVDFKLAQSILGEK